MARYDGEEKKKKDVESICQSEDVEVRDKVKYRNKRRRLCLFRLSGYSKQKKRRVHLVEDVHLERWTLGKAGKGGCE